MNEQTVKMIQSAIRYYAVCLRRKAKLKDSLPIGLPLQFWFPELRAAVEISGSGDNRHKELLKNELCRKYGIDLIRLLGPKDRGYPQGSCLCVQLMDHSEETMEAAVSSIFELFGLYPDVNLSRDRNGIGEFLKENEEETIY